MANETLHSINITNTAKNLITLLDAAELTKKIPTDQTILIKPNLVKDLPPPVTTPVRLVALLIEYLQERRENVRIIIGEGTGSLRYDTHHPFQMLGYTKMATEKNIHLLDLNVEPLTERQNTACKRWPVMHLPSILNDVFLLSVPVLKAHTLSDVTLTMKNMMGCVPPSHYRGNGYWGKSKFHKQVHEAIFDLNRYRTPDFTLLDASIGMSESHLRGAHCNPPINILAASSDPVAIDAYGASLLGYHWSDIKHIALANKVLGNAEDFFRL